MIQKAAATNGTSAVRASALSLKLPTNQLSVTEARPGRCGTAGREAAGGSGDRGVHTRAGGRARLQISGGGARGGAHPEHPAHVRHVFLDL